MTSNNLYSSLYKFHDKPESVHGYDKAHETVPRLVWQKYHNDPAALKKHENILAKDAEVALLYAQTVLDGPFPKGEKAISKDEHATDQYIELLMDYGKRGNMDTHEWYKKKYKEFMDRNK
jgi:hypothetical protein